MYKLTVREPEKKQLQETAEDLRVGEIGVVVNVRDYEGDILLRCFGNKWVSLKNPASTWSNSCLLEIRRLPPGTVIELVLE